MTIELKMPALSPTMEKGNLAKWLVVVGDQVRPGDIIAEIETDKATMEMEAVDEGCIASLVVPEGTDDVRVGSVIALISRDSQGSSGALQDTRVPEHVLALMPVPRDIAPPQFPVRQDGISATPLVKRIATTKAISLDGIVGTGSRGRIVKADLGLHPAFVAPRALPPAPMPAASTTAAPPPPGVPVETVRLSGMRRTIARRLAEAKQSIPHFYLMSRCVLDPLLELRRDVNASLQSRGIKVSVNDMLVKALALALAAVPDCNVQFDDDVLHRFGRVDIAMAVAVEGGLVTPVIKDAGALSLSAIATISQALAAKARSGNLTPEDYQGGTASLSNLGMFGIENIVPVINPPQALILGVGAGIEQPWKVEGEIRLATLMEATASFDHRAIDGATGARFMAALRDLIEHPLAMLC